MLVKLPDFRWFLNVRGHLIVLYLAYVFEVHGKLAWLFIEYQEVLDRFISCFDLPSMMLLIFGKLMNSVDTED
jgi:hypothetical protein